MHQFDFFVFITISFCGLYHIYQVSGIMAVAPPKPKQLREIIRLRTVSTPKQKIQPTSIAQPRKIILSKSNLLQQQKQIQRRDAPFQQTFLGVPVQIENVQPNQPAAPGGNLYPKVPPVKPLVKPNETEAERAERIHKSFERLLTFVEIVGQVDNYVSSKWKNLVKTVSNFYEAEDDPYRVSSKRIYGSCPHAQ